MRKGLLIAGAVIAGLFITASIHAATTQYTQSANIVTVPVTALVPNADDVVFQASAQVQMSGASELTNYAHAAHHSQVEGKKNGRQFGMSGGVSSIFWQDIEANAPVTVAVTNSSAFATNFVKM